MPRTGRRPGPSTTRAEILDAARTLFGAHGYDGTTIRMIAEAARVDSALVVRSFEGKDALFRAAVRWPWDPAETVPRVAVGPRSRAGRRIAQLVVETWDDPDQRAPVLALIGSAVATDTARGLMGEFVTSQVLVPFAAACGFDRPELRGALLAAELLGLMMVRHVLAVQPLAGLATATVVDIAGPLAQRILTMPVPEYGDR